jgi:hypothetical protein
LHDLLETMVNKLGVLCWDRYGHRAQSHTWSDLLEFVTVIEPSVMHILLDLLYKDHHKTKGPLLVISVGYTM